MSSQTQSQTHNQSQNIPANAPPPFTAPLTPPEQTPPTPSPEQQELMNIINELVIGAQEISFELATLPHELIEKHPELKDWYETSKRLVLTVKKLMRFLRSRRTG